MVSMEFHPTPVGGMAISESGFVFGPGDSRRDAQAHNELWRYVTSVARTGTGTDRRAPLIIENKSHNHLIWDRLMRDDERFVPVSDTRDSAVCD